MRGLCCFLLFPFVAVAQSLPATHSHSGISANTARITLERDGRRSYAPKFYAYPMPLPSAVEYFPGLKLPGQSDEFKRPASLVRIAKPEYRLPLADLGIGDQHDVLFFGETQLVRMRVRLTLKGESLQERWLKPLRAFFDHLDRDNDGYLNKHEAEYVVPNLGIQQMMQSGFFTPSFTDAAKLLADFDLDQDGRINFDEFSTHYIPSASRIITVQANPVRDFYADPLTDEMFKLLDTNKDGKLSKSELEACEKMFSTLDADEDECLIALELVPTLLNRGVPAPRPTQDQLNANQPLIAYKIGAIPDTIFEQILTRYDKDKNLRLSQKESPFDPAVFAALDKNKDNELTVTELMAWRALPPDVELEMKLAEKVDENTVSVTKNNIDKTASFQGGTAGVGLVKLGTQTVQLTCNPPRYPLAKDASIQFFQFPDNGKGFITEKDIGGPQFQALRVLFDVMDRDSDNKVTRPEFDAFMRLQNNFRSTPLTLVYAAQTPSLFHLMDANGDGRLSMREVRNVWSRLIALEPNGKDYVTRAALQPQGALRFGRTNEVFNVNPVTTYTQTGTRIISQRGPLWFRKLDRNGDGELSRREFPGTEDEFALMDTDKDGYISIEEAEALDKKVRK